MRFFLISTAVAALCSPAFADQIETAAPVREVTVFPWGASVTRSAELTVPAGKHELVIPGLPEGTDPATLRVTADGAVLGAVSLQEGRALPSDAGKTPEIAAAEAEVNRLETALLERDARVNAILARAQAAEDTVAFLLAMAESDGLAQSDIATLANSVGAEILKARETAIAANTEAAAAAQGRDDAERALENARARLDALRPPEGEGRTLVVAIEAGAEPVRLSVTSLTADAQWEPIYDAWLQREAKTLTLDRGLMIAQNSGEDWRDVKLTLSTSRPADQTAPSVLTPIFEETYKPSADKRMSDYSYDEGSARVAVAPAPVMAEAASVITAGIQYAGEVVTYVYPEPVTIRDGVDALRLELDTHQLTPEIRAEAVPTRDSTAYLVAETTNSLDDLLLPGRVTLYRDGLLAGQSRIEQTPTRDRLQLGFGPIDGMKVEYQIPKEATGDRGILSKSNTATRSAILRVSNLTNESWPLRVIGQVPVTRQDDLKIGWSSTPEPTTQDRDGQRGILEWDSTIAPAQVQDISLTIDLNWPDGMSILGNY